MATKDDPLPTETLIYQPDAVVLANTDIDLPTVCPGASQYRKILQAVKRVAGATAVKLTVASAAPVAGEIWLEDGKTIELGDATALQETYEITLEKGYYSKAGA